MHWQFCHQLPVYKTNSTLPSTITTAQNLPCAHRGHKKPWQPHPGVLPKGHGPSAGKEKTVHTSSPCTAWQVMPLLLNTQREERAHWLVSATRKTAHILDLSAFAYNEFLISAYKSHSIQMSTSICHFDFI